MRLFFLSQGFNKHLFFFKLVLAVEDQLIIHMQPFVCVLFGCLHVCVAEGSVTMSTIDQEKGKD